MTVTAPVDLTTTFWIAAVIPSAVLASNSEGLVASTLIDSVIPAAVPELAAPADTLMAVMRAALSAETSSEPAVIVGSGRPRVAVTSAAVCIAIWL